MTCEICGIESGLENHHISYEKNETMIVCKKCHEKIHHTDKYPQFKPVDKNDSKSTLIQVDKDLVQVLKDRRLTSRESYNEVLWRLVKKEV